MHGLTPQYLVDPVPSLRRHLFSSSVTNDLHPMRWRNLRFKNSFYPDAVQSWNNIGPELRKVEKISTFKSSELGMIKPEEKNIFNIHSQDLRYLYQLRVGLSSLKAHKHRHKFLDTPNDTCVCSSGAESTTHFLLCCPIFNTHRERLMETVKPILSKLNLNIDNNPALTQFLLYGNKALTHAQNQGILNATLTYIRNTGRFSRDISKS